jgi:Spy/CpxP family protein refolding chaperone
MARKLTTIIIAGTLALTAAACGASTQAVTAANITSGHLEGAIGALYSQHVVDHAQDGGLHQRPERLYDPPL